MRQSNTSQPKFHRHCCFNSWKVLLAAIIFAIGRCSSFLPVVQSRRVRDLAGLSLNGSKSGGILVNNEQEFQDEVLSADATKPVLCFFTAPWCGPCRMSLPVVKEIMKDFGDKMDMYEVCTDDTPEIAESSGVVSIPTIQMYCKGELEETIIGCVAKSVLAKAIEKVLEDSAKRFGVDIDT